MKKLLYIALLLSACKRQPEDGDLEYPCALYAVFESGKTPEADVVCITNNADEFNRLDWLWSDGSSDAFVIANERWILESNRLPEPNESCTLRWEATHGTMKVPVHFPPMLELETLSADSLLIDQNESIEVQWTNLGEDYEYLFLLECIEENAAPIGQQSGDFNTVHSGPQSGNTLSLEVQNFTYRGAHRLVIYALNRAFTDIYFQDPSDIRGLLKMPISNLPGAKGYIMCVTAVEVQIVVE
jgi:hypothetical protein